MPTYKNQLDDSKHFSQLSDFDLLRQPQPPRSASRAAIHISERFGLSLDHAATVASLAGIGIGQEKR
jgi:hypothetical protein